MTSPNEWAQRVLRAFEAIHAERMQDLPILNPALRVETVGFRRWQGATVGIVITPWFMSLLRLGADDTDRRVGTMVRRGLPAGTFEFMVSHEPALGHYESCSLFSPVFEFQDQGAARQVAEALLNKLFEPQEPTESAAERATPPGLMERPVSRRAWLRGAWGRKPAKEDGK